MEQFNLEEKQKRLAPDLEVTQEAREQRRKEYGLKKQHAINVYWVCKEGLIEKPFYSVPPCRSSFMFYKLLWYLTWLFRNSKAYCPKCGLYLHGQGFYPDVYYYWCDCCYQYAD